MIFDLLFPSRCLHCRAFVKAPLCPTCLEHFPWESPGDRLFRSRASGIEGLDRLWVLGRFEGLLADLIHRMKYQKEERIAENLGEWAATLLPLLDQRLLVPVPLHPSRLRERGFNQSWCLARGIGRRLKLKADPLSLERRHQTPPQTTLSRAERLKNLRGVFRTRSGLSGKNILLVDDVFTTGATLGESVRALKEAGAATVEGLVLACTA